MKRFSVFLTVAALSAGLCLPAQAALEIGDKAPAFALPSVDGRQVSLDGFSAEKAVVLVFTCNSCPYAQAYQDRIVALQRDYAPRGVQVVAINSNDASKVPQDSFQNMKLRAAEKSFNFPYLYDESQEVARAYGAERTPHIFVFGEDRTLKYTGKIDDNWENAGAVKVNYLRQALDDLLEGKAIPEPKTFAIGCTIKWK